MYLVLGNITSSESSYTNDTQNGTVKNVFDVYDSTEADSKETLGKKI